MEVTRAGSLASFAYRSMYALVMPISSRIAAESDSACFWLKSARIFDERSATDCTTLGSTCGIAHDAIRAVGPFQAPGVVEVMQMGYRFAHGEERLVRVERPAEQQPQQLACAQCFFLQGFDQLREVRLVVTLELRDARMGAAERLAVRGKHQHVLRQLAVALQRLEEQAQRIALGVDRPDADVGRDGREQHVAGDDDVERLAVEREVLGRVAMADEGAPLVAADLHSVALDDPSVGERKLRPQ